MGRLMEHAAVTARQVTAEQLDLFGGFDAPAVAPCEKKPRAHRPAANQPQYQQLTICDEFTPLLPRLEMDLEDAEDYPVHLIRSAANCERPQGLGPASIFQIGASSLSNLMGRPTVDQDPPPIHRKILRTLGTTKHISLRLQDTEEWAEKERKRRAKQKPPRPTKQKFKMKGSREWGAHQS